MNDRQFGRAVSELIRTRRAQKKLKARETHLADQIKAEMEARGTWYWLTSMGDITRYERKLYTLDIGELFDRFKRGEIIEGRLAKPQITNLRAALGSNWVEEHCDHTESTQLLTKPAKKKVKVKVVLTGCEPAI